MDRERREQPTQSAEQPQPRCALHDQAIQTTLQRLNPVPAGLLRRDGRILRDGGVAFAGFVGSISRRWLAWGTVTRGCGLIVSLWHISSVTGHLGVARKFLKLPRLLPAL